ncbi:MAG: thiamine phosphate synthase [Alphaproteobacteria bacterium]|jgi:thiamine-phosphate pyrophosphorylase|nr:thiamine phosphate synthase [Candidatus Jidaibacter sp.]
MKARSHLLTLVTNKGTKSLANYLQFVKNCIDAGITCVQLREKSYSYEELLCFGRQLKNLLDAYNIPLIINDHVSLCTELDAAGIHLGQSDQDPREARVLLGSHKIIGLSIDNLQQAFLANDLPIDYIGVGAIFYTHSKTDIKTFWGLDGLEKVSSITHHPIIAIGGINLENALSIMYSGASGIAAISAFHDTNHPEISIRKLATIRKVTQG